MSDIFIGRIRTHARFGDKNRTKFNTIEILEYYFHTWTGVRYYYTHYAYCTSVGFYYFNTHFGLGKRLYFFFFFAFRAMPRN